MDMTKALNMNTQCVECMCLMTLFQEHISVKHSQSTFFELSEWQQAGYKQKIKWTLECDRCDFKTTSKIKMFEHIANHQVLENTVQRITQSAAGTPSIQVSKVTMNTPLDMRSTTCEAATHAPHDEDISDYASSPSKDVATSQDIVESNENNVPPVKEEASDAILIHMEEDDIEDVNNFQEPPAPPPLQKNLSSHPTKAPTHQHLNPEKSFGSKQNEEEVDEYNCQQQTKSDEATSYNHDFRCGLCDFTGPTSDSLMYHSRNKHNNYNCNICTYVGGKAIDLELHMSNIHQSLLCIYCGVHGGNVRTLRRHYSLDHGTRKKECKRCNFTTFNQTVLTNHVNVVHFKRKPRSCPHCDYVAYTDAAVKQHVVAIHEKQRPFTCLKCPMSFARKFQVKEHMKRKHRMDLNAILSVSHLPTTEPPTFKIEDTS